MTHRPALLLLAVLLGGLGASWVDAGYHAAEWAEGRVSHQASVAHNGDTHGDGDWATTPCDDGSLRIDCAVCAGLSGAVAVTGATGHAAAAESHERVREHVYAGAPHTATPGRGPPAAA